MEKLIEELNKQTNNEYKFTLKSATLTKAADFCMLEILYRDGIMLSAEKKEELKNIILSIVPKEFKYDVSFIKNFISEERIENEFKEYMKNHFPSVFFTLNSVNKDNMTFYISLLVDNNSYAHTKQKNLKTDVEKFFKVVDSCVGRVELVTGEGDRLNLKSKLSQYVSMANIFSDGAIKELEIIAYEKEDIDKLVSFMYNG